MALLPGSQAKGAGSVFDDENNSPIATDQRGFLRATSGNNNIDIGAFQSQTQSPLVVTTLQDDNQEGAVGSGQLSLRDAINLADVFANAT
jgi:hypothetical protein